MLFGQEHIRRAVVVTGSDGLDEVTLEGPTHVRLVEPDRREYLEWEPKDFDLAPQCSAALRVGDARESAARLTRIFEGERGPGRDYVLANAAAALWVTGEYSLRAGVAAGAAALDSGAAVRLLHRWKQLAPASPEHRIGERGDESGRGREADATAQDRAHQRMSG